MDLLVFIAVIAVVGFVLYKKVPKVKSAIDGVVGKLKGGDGA